MNRSEVNKYLKKAVLYLDVSHSVEILVDRDDLIKICKLAFDGLDSDRERIVGVAIQIENVVVSKEFPASHNDIDIYSLKLSSESMSTKTEGFITSEGRFLNRYQSARVACRANQIELEKQSSALGPHGLISSDIKGNKVD